MTADFAHSYNCKDTEFDHSSSDRNNPVEGRKESETYVQDTLLNVPRTYNLILFLKWNLFLGPTMYTVLPSGNTELNKAGSLPSRSSPINKRYRYKHIRPKTTGKDICRRRFWRKSVKSVLKEVTSDLSFQRGIVCQDWQREEHFSRYVAPVESWTLIIQGPPSIISVNPGPSCCRDLINDFKTVPRNLLYTPVLVNEYRHVRTHTHTHIID